MLRLEAIPAKEGDCLILHFDDDNGAARKILIDGGPSGVYPNFLRPRLESLRQEAGGELVFDLGVLSHIDGDHVQGLLDMTDELVIRSQSGGPKPYRFREFWHNAFGGLTGGAEPASLASLEGAARTAAAGDVLSSLPYKDPRTGAIIASVGQGARLQNNLAQLGVTRNDGFDQGLVLAPDAFQFRGLGVTVVGPLKADLEKLRQIWKKDLPKAKVAAYVDGSIPNLASIVLLVEKDGRRLLLTGDARGDKVLEGLEAAGKLAPGGTLALDLLKLPHHGSVRNVEPNFFERLPARHYVVSANGRHGNPEPKALRMLVDARKSVAADQEFDITFAMKLRTQAEQDTLVAVLDQLKGERLFTYRFGPDASGQPISVAL